MGAFYLRNHAVNISLECSTLSIKHVRRIIEQDLGLEKKSLDQQKDVVAELIDKVGDSLACKAPIVVHHCILSAFTSAGSSWCNHQFVVTCGACCMLLNDIAISCCLCPLADHVPGRCS